VVIAVVVVLLMMISTMMMGASTIHTHNRENEFYRFHVLKIGQTDFCNGCFANRIFLAILLPFHIYFLTSDLSFLLKISLISYVLFNVLIIGIMALTGRKLLIRSSEIITFIYLFSTHLILLFGEMKLDFSITLILSLIFIFSLPQFTMYMWKVIYSNEFKYPVVKLLIRLSFIHGYLFAVILTRYEPVIGLIVILFSSTLFIALRTFSSHISTGKNDFPNNPKKMNLIKATMNFSMAHNDDPCEACLGPALCCMAGSATGCCSCGC